MLVQQCALLSVIDQVVIVLAAVEHGTARTCSAMFAQRLKLNVSYVITSSGWLVSVSPANQAQRIVSLQHVVVFGQLVHLEHA